MSQQNVEIAKRATDAYNRRDLELFFDELVTPDFEWFPALTRALDGGGYRGREGVERFLADTRESWEELQVFAEEFRDLGDQVLLLGRMRGRGRGSGAEVDAPIANVIDFRDGRMWRTRVYFDCAEALKAVGLEE